MDRKTKLEWRRKYSRALGEHAKKGNWEKIEELLPAAENIGVSGRQLHKAWMELGNDQKRQDKLVSALVSFASARHHSIDDQKSLGEILDCLDGFCDLFTDKFSREDLVHLEYGLERLYSFHKTRSKTSDENLRKAKELLTRIKAAKDQTSSRAETPATAHVLRIYSALYPNMTQEEVAAEFARIVAPLVRRKLAETTKSKHTEKRKAKKRKNIKKP